MCGSPSAIITLEQAKPLDDYMTHFMMELAAERNFCVFFHVGIHAWNENSIEAIHGSYLEILIR